MMTNIRVTCQSCGVVAQIRPAQVLLLTDAAETRGTYLFLCPVCERLTVRFAEPAELRLLADAGVLAGATDGETTDVRPGSRPESGRPFTPDDVLDFHFLLATDGWFPRLAGFHRRPLSG